MTRLMHNSAIRACLWSGLLVLATAQVLEAAPCPTFTYTNPRSIDPLWPDAYYNKFPMMPNPISPSESEGCIQTPPGFSARLWASEEAQRGGIRAVLAIAWDERGRLWVAESYDYPHDTLPVASAFSGKDRIVVLEDRNGDGVADSAKVFASGLNLVSGLVHATNGLVVAMSRHLVLFKDENGDDVADNPTGQILYTGFSHNTDTHGMHNNLTYGLDNWIYGIMGYNSSTVNGVTTQGGIWRAKSDGTAFQFLTPTSSENAHGIGMTEGGQFFFSRANRDHSRHMAYRYNTTNGTQATAIIKVPTYNCAAAPSEVPPVPSGVTYSCPRPVTTHWHINNPGFSSESNHAIYTARHFPQKYWDRSAFICEGPRHLCHSMFLSKNNSSWSGSEDSTAGYNIFASTDAWTAPIIAQTGPDGAVWVVDWYNYLMSHNWYSPKAGNAQVSAIRNNTRGRVYRVVYDSRPLDAVLDLTTATEDGLLAALYHPNLLWRLQAQRILLKRGSNTGLITKLTTILNLKTVNEMGESPHVVHALRTLEGFGLFTADPATWVPVLKDLLLHPSPAVRWNAMDAMPINALSTAAILDQGRINDPDAHVRLRALQVLTTMPGTKSGAMYTPYVSLDAISQNRYTAVGGLTSSATMPTTPALYAPVAVAPGQAPIFRSRVSVEYRNGNFFVLGAEAGLKGTLTVWNLRGERVTRLPVESGRAAALKTTLRNGTYTFRVDMGNGYLSTGKFSTF
jgi:putative membrane-bound dehydrogenase-like protein